MTIPKWHFALWLQLIAFLSGCKAPDSGPSKAFVAQRTDSTAVTLPDGINSHTRRARTYRYWHSVSAAFQPCIVSETSKPENVYTMYVQQEVLKNIARVSVKGVDEDAVKAVSSLLNVQSEDSAIAAKNTEEAVKKTGSDITPLMTAPQDGQFGNSIDGAGIAVGNGVAAGLNSAAQFKAIRKRIDMRLEESRRLLEARYGDSYTPIQIGENSCLSIKLRWK